MSDGRAARARLRAPIRRSRGEPLLGVDAGHVVGIALVVVIDELDGTSQASAFGVDVIAPDFQRQKILLAVGRSRAGARMLKPTLIGSAARAGTVAHWTTANYESCVKTSARIARVTPATPKKNRRNTSRSGITPPSLPRYLSHRVPGRENRPIRDVLNKIRIEMGLRSLVKTPPKTAR